MFQTKLTNHRNSMSSRSRWGIVPSFSSAFGQSTLREVWPQLNTVKESEGRELRLAANQPGSPQQEVCATTAHPLYRTDLFLHLSLGKSSSMVPWASFPEGKLTGKLMGQMRVLIFAAVLKAVAGAHPPTPPLCILNSPHSQLPPWNVHVPHLVVLPGSLFLKCLSLWQPHVFSDQVPAQVC